MFCLVLVALFVFIVLRALRHAMRSEDPFARFAAAGLAILFGLQSAINMAVNLHLMPAKGMTLPFISYGGSSMISIAYGMGMLLALTRERPRAELLAANDSSRGRPACPVRPGSRPRSGREGPTEAMSPALVAVCAAGRNRRPSVSRRSARRKRSAGAASSSISPPMIAPSATA